MFAKTLGYRDGLSEEHLLVLTEELVIGTEIVWATGAHHARGKNHKILLVGIGTRKSPLERKGSAGVTHRHEHTVRAKIQ